MSIKNKLLKEIDRKAEKIREKRVEAANNKTLESAVFDFFRNIEDSRQMSENKTYDKTLYTNAVQSLKERLKRYDRGVKISVEFNVQPLGEVPTEQTIRGVTIWWSSVYILKHNVHPSMYIDVAQMLFL